MVKKVNGMYPDGIKKGLEKETYAVYCDYAHQGYNKKDACKLAGVTPSKADYFRWHLEEDSPYTSRVVSEGNRKMLSDEMKKRHLHNRYQKGITKEMAGIVDPAQLQALQRNKDQESVNWNNYEQQKAVIRQQKHQKAPFDPNQIPMYSLNISQPPAQQPQPQTQQQQQTYQTLQNQNQMQNQMQQNTQPMFVQPPPSHRGGLTSTSSTKPPVDYLAMADAALANIK